jgi:hypothetical protein
MLRIMGLRVEAFSEVTGGRPPSFRDLSLGETAAPSASRGMRRGQNSPGGKSQKRPARSLGTKEKASTLGPIGGGHLMPPSLQGEVYALGFVTILCWCERPPVFQFSLGS